MINRLVSELKNEYTVFLTKQPTPSVRESEIFRAYMDSPDHSSYEYRSLSLFAAADRVQHSNKVIEAEMNKGKIVISDRYFYRVLQISRTRYKKDRWIYEIAESIIKPDISFFLDVPISEAIYRVRCRKEEQNRYIDVQLQYNLQKEYHGICKMNGGIMVPTGIEPDRSYEYIIKEVRKVLIKMDFRKKVYEIIGSICGLEVDSQDKSLSDDLGIDSLGMVALLIELEDSLNIELEESDMNPLMLKTTEDIVKLAEKYI